MATGASRLWAPWGDHPHMPVRHHHKAQSRHCKTTLWLHSRAKPFHLQHRLPPLPTAGLCCKATAVATESPGAWQPAASWGHAHLDDKATGI